MVRKPLLFRPGWLSHHLDERDPVAPQDHVDLHVANFARNAAGVLDVSGHPCLHVAAVGEETDGDANKCRVGFLFGQIDVLPSAAIGEPSHRSDDGGGSGGDTAVVVADVAPRLQRFPVREQTLG